jgi:hypothetical protein
MSQGRLAGDWINSFLEMTEDLETVTSYRLWTAISVVSAALQQKCVFRLGSLTIFPNLYTVLVGPSGTGKGTAMSPGRRLLARAGIKVASTCVTREALIREIKESYDSDINPEEGTITMHSSLTVFSPEFTVFLGYNNVELMSNLCDWYDADVWENIPWIYRTKNQGTDKIEGIWVNIIGGTTPKLIASAMPQDAIGGGLTARIIFVFEQTKDKISIIPRWGDREREIEEKLLIDLEKIHMIKGEFRATERFIEIYSDWRIKSEKEPPIKDPRFSGYLHRRPSHLLKICLTMSASRSSDMLLTEIDINRAIDVQNEAEKKMSLTFAGVGKSPLAEVSNRVLVELDRRKKMSFEDLMSVFYYDTSKWEMERILETLQSSRLIFISHEGQTSVITRRKE